MTRTYTVVLEKESVGGYSVYVPAIPGCYTDGDTIAEALAMAREAITLCLRGMVADGEPIPPDTSSVVLDVSKHEPILVREVTVNVPEAATVAKAARRVRA
jgi:predicted RNase H-like HicB family nuclease